MRNFVEYSQVYNMRASDCSSSCVPSAAPHVHMVHSHFFSTIFLNHSTTRHIFSPFAALMKNTTKNGLAAIFAHRGGNMLRRVSTHLIQWRYLVILSISPVACLQLFPRATGGGGGGGKTHHALPASHHNPKMEIMGGGGGGGTNY